MAPIMRVRILGIPWEPLPAGIGSLSQIEKALERWRDTPYASGQRSAGYGADCIGFACGAVDDVDGRPRASDPRVPADSCLHDPERSRAAVRRLLAVYEPWIEIPKGDPLQPLDFLVVGPAGGGPGHVILVGPRRNTLWHCTLSAGVHQAGWALGTGYEILHHAYRLGDRERWPR
jgi:hypothetical protein